MVILMNFPNTKALHLGLVSYNDPWNSRKTKFPSLTILSGMQRLKFQRVKTLMFLRLLTVWNYTGQHLEHLFPTIDPLPEVL